MKKKVMLMVISIAVFLFVSCLLAVYAIDDVYGGNTASEEKDQYYSNGSTSQVTFSAKENYKPAIPGIQQATLAETSHTN